MTLGPDSEVAAGRNQINVEGYGHEGSIVVETRDDSEDVRITAVLIEG